MRLAKLGQSLGKRGIGERQQCHRVEPGVVGAGLPDRERRDRDAGRHLDDREQGIESLEVPAGHRHAEHRERRLGGEHAGKMGGAAGTGDDAAESSPGCLRGITEEEIGRAVGGNHSSLVRHAELLEPATGVLHGLPVGIAAHDDANEGFRHWVLWKSYSASHTVALRPIHRSPARQRRLRGREPRNRNPEW